MSNAYKTNPADSDDRRKLAARRRQRLWQLEDKDELRSLPQLDQVLLRRAADAAEQSYRRGFQQGALAMRFCVENKQDQAALESEIQRWRFQRRPYRASLDAPGLGPQEGGGVSVIARFLTESAGERFDWGLRGINLP